MSGRKVATEMVLLRLTQNATVGKQTLLMLVLLGIEMGRDRKTITSRIVDNCVKSA